MGQWIIWSWNTWYLCNGVIIVEIKEDHSEVKWKDNGKLKLLILVGTRPEIIRLLAVINKCRKYFDTELAYTG